MATSDPRLVQDHAGRDLSVPHEVLYRAMRRFLADLAGAEEAYRQEVAAIRDKFRIAAEYRETVDVQRYSLAIQVFAAITVEAAISFYAVLRFGGRSHDQHFRWDRADKRLQKAMGQGGISLNDDAEILRAVRGVMEARHGIVHPFSVEYLGAEGGTIEQPNRPGPDETAAAARQAVADVDRFFALLRDADPAHAHYFIMPWG